MTAAKGITLPDSLLALLGPIGGAMLHGKASYSAYAFALQFKRVRRGETRTASLRVPTDAGFLWLGMAIVATDYRYRVRFSFAPAFVQVYIGRSRVFTEPVHMAELAGPFAVPLIAKPGQTIRVRISNGEGRVRCYFVTLSGVLGRPRAVKFRDT